MSMAFVVEATAPSIPYACSTEGAIRLVGTSVPLYGRYRVQGRLEVCMGGAWGAVCSAPADDEYYQVDEEDDSSSGQDDSSSSSYSDDNSGSGSSGSSSGGSPSRSPSPTPSPSPSRVPSPTPSPRVESTMRSPPGSGGGRRAAAKLLRRGLQAASNVYVSGDSLASTTSSSDSADGAGDWDGNLAIVVCRQFPGFDDKSRLMATPIYAGDSRFPQPPGFVKTTIGDVRCQAGKASVDSIAECNYSRSIAGSCSASQLIGVQCISNAKVPTSGGGR